MTPVKILTLALVLLLSYMAQQLPDIATGAGIAPRFYQLDYVDWVILILIQT